MSEAPQTPDINPEDVTTERMLAELETAIAAKNNISIERFQNHWAPLFRKDGMQQLGQAAYNQLGREYMRAIDPFRPVNIVAKGADGKVAPVAQLPPLFTRTKEITEINTRMGPATDLISIFHSSQVNPRAINPELEQAVEGMAEAFTGAIDIPLAKANAAIFNQAAVELHGPGAGGANPAATPTASKDPTAGMEWE